MTATIHAMALRLANSDPGRVEEVECRNVARAYLEAEAKLARIKALCQRYDGLAVHSGTHGLAGAILRIIEGERDA